MNHSPSTFTSTGTYHNYYKSMTDCVPNDRYASFQYHIRYALLIASAACARPLRFIFQFSVNRPFLSFGVMSRYAALDAPPAAAAAARRPPPAARRRIVRRTPPLFLRLRSFVPCR
ncbi:hypothetical protein EVAR_88860_1 [Eumeta japonica]|uniref:Uncharacterized protein n=1 Tax=Eumeta variegata TaxID=151549 RepID=A0A4C1Y8E8_EUMVA|nr:hypothetical protein EVAR_88860_1 [Eumeta japonica]